MALDSLFSRLKGGAGSGNFGHGGRPGKKGGSTSKFGMIQNRNDLEELNGGIYSTYAELPNQDWNFHDKFLVGIHNSNAGKERLREYASKNPKDYNKYRTAMLFSMWEDSGTPQSFETFSNSKIKVYRGGQEGNLGKNKAYSTEERIAQSFADYGPQIGMFREKLDIPGKVYTKTISPKDILYYSNAQGEAELVLK